jgi:isochorismate hydrolase
MAARLTRHKIAGVSVPVSPPEDNILLKAMWGRGADQGKHDWEDVEAMMTYLPTLDWEYLEWRAAAFARPQDVDEVLKRLGELWRQQGKIRTLASAKSTTSLTSF